MRQGVPGPAADRAADLRGDPVSRRVVVLEVEIEGTRAATATARVERRFASGTVELAPWDSTACNIADTAVEAVLGSAAEVELPSKDPHVLRYRSPGSAGWVAVVGRVEARSASAARAVREGGDLPDYLAAAAQDHGDESTPRGEWHTPEVRAAAGRLAHLGRSIGVPPASHFIPEANVVHRYDDGDPIQDAAAAEAFLFERGLIRTAGLRGDRVALEVLREAARNPDLHVRPTSAAELGVADNWLVHTVNHGGDSVPWPDPEWADGQPTEERAIEVALVEFARSVRDDDPAGAA